MLKKTLFLVLLVAIYSNSWAVKYTKDGVYAQAYDETGGYLLRVSLFDGEVFGGTERQPYLYISGYPNLEKKNRKLSFILERFYTTVSNLMIAPPHHIKAYEIYLDNKAFQITKVDPEPSLVRGIRLPYTPKQVRVKVILAKDQKIEVSFKVPPSVNLNRSIDLRTSEVMELIKKEHYFNFKITDEPRKQLALTPPYKDKIAHRVPHEDDGGIRLSVQTTCMGSIQSGRIISSRLILAEHYFYSPGQSKVLTETSYIQPVYGVAESVSLSIRMVEINDDKTKFRYIYPQQRKKDDVPLSYKIGKYPAKFKYLCTTEKGKILTHDFRYQYSRRRHSKDWGWVELTKH